MTVLLFAIDELILNVEEHTCNWLQCTLLLTLMNLISHTCFVAILGFVFKERQLLESNWFGIYVF